MYYLHPALLSSIQAKYQQQIDAMYCDIKKKEVVRT